MAVALTTVFTPPPACATMNITLLEGYYFDQDYYWFAWLLQRRTSDANMLGPSTTCYPSGFVSGAGIFSPGLVCPSGFLLQSAASDSTDIITTKYCCPSGFNYETDGKFACGSIVPTTTATSTIITQDSYHFALSLPTATTVTSPNINFPAITLLYKQNEMSLLNTSQTDTTSENSNATPLATISGISSSGSTTTPPSSQLSPGAKAGIGVGCAIGLVFLIGGIYLFRRRYRNIHGHDDSGGGAPELFTEPDVKPNPADKDKSTDARAELVASDLYPSHELKGSPAEQNTQARAELTSTAVYPSHELSGSSVEHAVELQSGMEFYSDNRRWYPQESELENQQYEAVRARVSSAQSTHLPGAQVPSTSGLDPNTLAGWEFEQLEQEEVRIREQKARLLARNQK